MATTRPNIDDLTTKITKDTAASMDFTSRLGIRVMLSEFFSLPATAGGEICHRWVDLGEPLWHNKTLLPYDGLDAGGLNCLKNRPNALNLRLKTSKGEANIANRPVAVTAPP